MASVKKNKGKQPVSSNKVNKTVGRKKIMTYWIISILVLTFIVFYNTLHNSFITNLDDTTYIASASSLKRLAFSDIVYMFSTIIAGNYHPLSVLSLTIDYSLFGQNAFPYHLMNLVLHLANVVLVFWFIYFLAKRIEAAVIVSLFFAIHPMHVESVAWISERKDVLYTLFFMGSLICYMIYLKYGYKYRYLIYSLVLFCLSLLSKPAAVCLAPVVVLIDYYLKRKLNLKTILEKVLYFLLALAFGIITILSQRKFGALSALTDFKYVFTLFDRIFLISYAVMFYIVKTITPFYLSAIYYYPQKDGNMLPWIFYFAPLGIAFIVFLVIKFKTVRRELIFGFIFFLFTIALVLQFIPVGFTIVSDRYTYVPYIGLFFIIGKLYCNYVDNKFGNFTKGGRNFIVLVIAAAIVLFSVTTIQRNKVWASGIVLFDDVVKKNPTIGHAYWARGVGKFDMNDYKGALEDYTDAINHNYQFPVAYNNKANCYYMLDSLPQALAGYNQAIKVFDKYAMAYYNRGTAKQKMKDYNGSIDDYMLSIKYDFEHLSWAYNGLGYSYYSMNEFTIALTNLNKAIEIDKEYPNAYFNRGCVEYAQKEYTKASDDFTKTLEIDKTYVSALYNRGIMKIQLKDTASACIDFNKALELGYSQANDALKAYCK
jgi:protein O-mannosyl-transferase